MDSWTNAGVRAMKVEHPLLGFSDGPGLGSWGSPLDAEVTKCHPIPKHSNPDVQGQPSQAASRREEGGSTGMSLTLSESNAAATGVLTGAQCRRGRAGGRAHSPGETLRGPTAATAVPITLPMGRSQIPLAVGEAR